jgi:hypothetical protein
MRAGPLTISVEMGGLIGSRTTAIALRRIDAARLGLSQVAFGLDHGCALASSGMAQCWGSNGRGALGRSYEMGSALGPVTGAPPFVTVDVGDFGACGITSTHELWCWGVSVPGLASASTSAVRVLEGHEIRQVSVGVSPFVELGTGVMTCAVTLAGEAWCWTSVIPPTRVAPGFALESVSVGGSGACGRQASGHIVCWYSTYPDVREVGGGPFISYGTSVNGACALTADGRAWCWGGTVNEPQLVAYAQPFTALAVSAQTTCGLTSAGELLCWGAHPSWRGVLSLTMSTPTPIAPSYRFAALKATSYGFCGSSSTDVFDCVGSAAVPVQP